MALPPSCQLFDLVLDMNWNNVVNHAKNHPEDASFQDGDCYETPLHLSCQLSPPPSVIEALIAAFPGALTIKSKSGDVPLHIACRYGASSDILSLLVEAHPATCLLQTKWGKTALMALCDGYQIDDDADKWEKVRILLQGVAQSQNLVRNDGTFLPVHAAVLLGSLGCPTCVLDRIAKDSPDQVWERDAPQGRLPLHLAIRSTEWSSKRRYKPREKYAIEILLALYPHSARVMCGGRLPLHIAVSNGHTWKGGVDALFHAYPEAGTICDPATKLFPFQLAAIPVGESQASLDTIFELLLAQPHLLHRCTHAEDHTRSTRKIPIRKQSEANSSGLLCFAVAKSVAVLGFFIGAGAMAVAAKAR